MVNTPAFPGLLVCALAAVSLVAALPLTESAQRHPLATAPHQPPTPAAAPPAPEAPRARAQRSANLGHITGSARKIQMYVQNMYLQLTQDGRVSGTSDDASDYVVLQRMSIGVGLVKIQGVATCLYLCMDNCGFLYGSRALADECVFNEMIEQNHYNTYSSARYSSDERTMYLALNRNGHPKRVVVEKEQPLGRQATHTRVLTQFVSPEAVDRLSRMLPQHRHGHQCPPDGPLPPPEPAEPEQEAVCRLRARRRKRKHSKCPDSLAPGGDNASSSHDRRPCQRVLPPVQPTDKQQPAGDKPTTLDLRRKRKLAKVASASGTLSRGDKQSGVAKKRRPHRHLGKSARRTLPEVLRLATTTPRASTTTTTTTVKTTTAMRTTTAVGSTTARPTAATVFGAPLEHGPPSGYGAPPADLDVSNEDIDEDYSLEPAPTALAPATSPVPPTWEDSTAGDDFFSSSAPSAAE